MPYKVYHLIMTHLKFVNFMVGPYLFDRSTDRVSIGRGYHKTTIFPVFFEGPDSHGGELSLIVGKTTSRPLIIPPRAVGLFFSDTCPRFKREEASAVS